MRFHDPDDETAQRYAAGSLPAPEAEAFEQHLLTCAACRDDVRLASLIRHELAAAGPLRRRTWTYAAGAGLAAALVIAIALPNRNTKSGLGAVASAPGYEGVAVRATTDAADSAFSAAMLLYKEGSFRESANAFRSARNVGADSVTTTFFLGTSLLLSGRAREAADELGRASRMGSNAYTAESHYFRAKALIRLGQKDEALSELEAAAAAESPIQIPARSLADSLRGPS